jgi:hypothetical protein
MWIAYIAIRKFRNLGSLESLFGATPAAMYGIAKEETTKKRAGVGSDVGARERHVC